MCTEIYGIDITKKVTPLMVRDAIMECFRQAHCADSGISSDDKEINKMYCHEIVKQAFANAGEDFDLPSKEGIIKSMSNLAEFSKKFRDQTIIQKHYKEIMKLVEKLEN